MFLPFFPKVRGIVERSNGVRLPYLLFILTVIKIQNERTLLHDVRASDRSASNAALTYERDRAVSGAPLHITEDRDLIDHYKLRATIFGSDEPLF